MKSPLDAVESLAKLRSSLIQAGMLQQLEVAAKVSSLSLQLPPIYKAVEMSPAMLSVLKPMGANMPSSLMAGLEGPAKWLDVLTMNRNLHKGISESLGLSSYLQDFERKNQILNNVLFSTNNFVRYKRVEDTEAVEIEVDMEERIQLATPEHMNIVVDEYKKIRLIIKDIKNQTLPLKGITPTQFEDLVAELMRKQGFDVKQSKRTRDGGFDILALVQGIDKSPLKYLVQCKHPSNPTKKVDVRIIREFKTVVDENSANKGLIVTSSYFSHDAIKENKRREFLISLKNYVDVMDWIITY